MKRQPTLPDILNILEGMEKLLEKTERELITGYKLTQKQRERDKRWLILLACMVVAGAIANIVMGVI